MAYTIISQNNTTTTLADENGNVITVPARVTLATSTDYTITKVNNNSVDLVDGNGKVIRGVPACVVLAGGGGGGDQHNLGYYADLTALQTAYPTGTDGDFAILGSTDTIWVWDSGTSAWKDTDTKGQVTSVNSQTGDVTITAASLGALATTGGTMTGDIKFESGGIKGGYVGAQGGYIRIGSGATPSNDDLYFDDKVMFYGATGGKIGTGQLPIDTVHTQKLNNGADIAVPTTGGTMAVIGVNTTATLAVADWSSSTQTVTVSGVKADSVVFVSPAPASASDYASAGILCTGQSADSLTFTATTTPSSAISVNIICL